MAASDVTTIRAAEPSDAAGIAAIDNHSVERTIVTFEEEPVSGAEMARRIENVRSESLPWLVAEEAGRLVGYASSRKWKSRSGYRFSAEITVSVEPGHARRGIGSTADGLKWADLDPVGAPGVKIADLWGDHAKGAFGAFFKLPAGFAAPLHTHTHDIKVVIVSGTYIQVPEGKPEFRIGPGSYFMQPGGNYRHTTSCDPASDCVFFAESNGRFDLKVVDQGKAPAKK